MNILPKLLFLFQTIPISINQSYFTNLNKIVNHFIWQNKKPRIRLKYLQNPKEVGGLTIPNWSDYYHAASLTWLIDWVTISNSRILTIEGHDLQSGWHTYLWEPKARKHKYFNNHLIRKALLNSWTNIKKRLYKGIPLWYAPLEAYTHPNLLKQNSILRYKDIINTYGELKTRADIESSGQKLEWWEFLQIQSKLLSHKKFSKIEQEKPIDKIFFSAHIKLIRKFYLCLTSVQMHLPQTYIQKWNYDLKKTINEDQWQKIWTHNLKMTLSTPFKENIIKMFYRWHFTPQKLAKFNKNQSPLCWKCQKSIGSFFHIWWQCPATQLFWNKIISWLEAILKIKIERTPESLLLGIINQKLSKEQDYLYIHITTAARMAFAQSWKEKEIPPNWLILNKIRNCAESSKLTLSLQNKEQSVFFKVWDPFYRWQDSFDNKQTQAPQKSSLD